MTAPNRKREVQVNFRVSPEELELIDDAKTAQQVVSNWGQPTGKPICERWRWTVMW